MGADSGIVRESLDLAGISVAPGDRLDSYDIVAVESGATPATMNFKKVCNAELLKQVTRLQATRRSVGGDALQNENCELSGAVTGARRHPHSAGFAKSGQLLGLGGRERRRRVSIE
jgi:hypothetical protein